MKHLSDSLKTLVAVGMAVALTACATTEEAPAPTEPTPAPEAAPAPAPAPTRSAAETYDVVKGDSLWGIAGQGRIYGNPYYWPLIYKANAGTIKDADLIYPGQSLTIERNNSASAIDAAVRHAKTRGEWSLGVVESTDKAYLSGSR